MVIIATIKVKRIFQRWMYPGDDFGHAVAVNNQQESNLDS